MTVDNEQVENIYTVIDSRVISKLKKAKIDVSEVPDDLKWVVDEATIARFNRIGSEGMSSESVEGHSVTFTDAEDALAPFESHINKHITDVNGDDDDETPRRGAIRAI